MISFLNATLEFFSHFESLKYIFNDNPLISLITIELLAATASSVTQRWFGHPLFNLLPHLAPPAVF